MAFSIGAVRFDLGADTATLSRDLKQARSMTDRYAKGVSKLFDDSRKSVNKLGTALVGAATAGTAAFVALTKQSLDYADGIAKTADKVGLSTDALQELRFAAGQSGVATDALDMSMQRFSRRLAEAAKGGGELKGTLEDYGIAVHDASGNLRSNEAVLNDVANAIAGASSEQEALRVAFKAFDSEGAALVNLLRQGADGMGAMREQARSLGLVIDEDLLRNAERANDSLDVLAKVIQANVAGAVLQLGPLIQAISKQIREDLVSGLDESGVSALDFSKSAARGLESAAKVLGVFLDGARGIQVLFKSGELAAEGFKAVMAVVFEALNRVLRDFQLDWNLFIAEPIKRAGELFRKDWDFTVSYSASTDIERLISEGAANIERVRKELDELLMREMPSEGVKRSLQGVIDKLDQVHLEADKAKKGVLSVGSGGAAGGGVPDARVAALKKYSEALKAAQFEADLFFDKQEALDSLYQEGKIGAAVYGEELDRLSDSLGDVGDSAAEASDFAKEFGLSFQSAFEDALVGGKAFSDVLKGLEQDIARIIIRKSVTEPLGNAVSSLIGSFDFGKLLGFSGGGFTGNGARAGGVDGQGGFLAVMHPNETVIDHAQGGAVAGGDQVNITFQVNSLDPSTAASVIVANRGLITGIIQQAYNKRGQRGPLGA